MRTPFRSPFRSPVVGRSSIWSSSSVEGHATLVWVNDRTMLTEPRYYNIRWMELLHEIGPRLQQFGTVL